MPITKREAAEMQGDADVIQWRLGERYSRDPARRKEERLSMDYADHLERMRNALTFEEFAPSWVGRAGVMP